MDPETEILFERLKCMVDDDRFQLYLEGAEKARRDRADELYGARMEGETIGEARGEARGIAIGEARSRAGGEIDTLIFILTKRLGVLPESLAERIRSLDELDEIDRLTDIALDVSTLDEFIKQLR